MRRHLFALGICLVLTLNGHGQDWPKLRDNDTKTYFVFLNTGKNRSTASRAFTQAQINQMQGEHVGNIGRLGRAGLCYLAGPLGDNGFIRGTLVLKARSHAEMLEYFKPDPFVVHGLLDVDAYEVSGDLSGFQKPEEPFALANYSLAMIKRGPNWTWGKPLFSQANALKKSEGLSFLASVRGSDDLCGVAFFADPMTDKLKALVSSDPLIKNGTYVIEWHPQLAAKGTLRR